MSFASEVKKELLSIDTYGSCCEKALMLGIMQGASEVVFGRSGKKIIIKSYLSSVIKKMMLLLKKNYQLESTIKYTDEEKLNKRRYYFLETIGDVDLLINKYHLLPFDDLTLEDSLLANDCCKSAFVAGMFIARGSINDPRKNCYHLEISSKDEEIANLIRYILRNHQIDAKVRQRKDTYTVYIKKSEEISSCLAFMGASSGVFYFEDSRIVRDISNMANRMANCDLANVKKSTEAAQKQLKAIAYIRRMGYFNKMPVRLQTMALMREEYPDATLDELSEFSDKMFGKILSKSGISHCLRSLMQFYEELRSKNLIKKD